MSRAFRVAFGGLLVLLGLAAAWFGARRLDRRGPGGVAGSSAAPGGSGVGAVERGEHSVVLLTLDTTRADHLEPYGATGVETPVLARLAARGVLFEHAVSVAPITLVAHTSILSGLYPLETGVRNNGTHYVSAEIRTLAERLQDRGYRTAAFASAAVLERRYGLAQGFEVYDDDLSSGRDRRPRMVADRPAEATVAAAAAWLSQLGAGERFFLWVHLYDPHAAYSPPPPFRDRFRERLYDGEIAYMDNQIGRLLAQPRLREADPLIVLVGDHGESLGEHGEQTHAILAYESTLHVPLIVVPPGAPLGTRVTAPVSQIDIVPTVLDLLGASAEATLPGSSLVPLFSGERPSSARPLYSETFLPFYTYGWARLRALRVGDWKLVQAPKRELFNLRRDPRELSNLFENEPGRAHDLERTLGELVARHGGGEREEAITLDTEAAERLRSLGYLAVGSRPPRVTGERPDPKEMIGIHVDLERARMLADQRLPEEAARVLQNLLRRDPQNLAALLDLAAALEAAGRVEEAVAAAERALALDPQVVRVHVLLAGLEARRGRREQALALLDGALAIDPRFLDARLQKALLLAQLGRLDAARAEIDVATADDPPMPRAEIVHVQLVELRDGNLDAARARLERALARDPFAIQGWRLLGEVEERARRSAPAESAYRSGLRREPDNAELHGRLGMLLARGGPTAEAESHLREAIRLARQFRSDLHVALGALLAVEGRLTEAQAEYEQVLKVDPGHPDARNNRAIALFRSGRQEEARRELEALLAERPRHADAWNNLAALAVERSDWSEVERCSRHALALRDDIPEAWNNLGISRQMAGDLGEAERSFTKALALRPEYVDASLNLALVWSISGRREEALRTLDELVTRFPGLAEAHLRLARLAAQSPSDPNRARAHFNAYLKLRPEGPEAREVRRELATLQTRQPTR